MPRYDVDPVETIQALKRKVQKGEHKDLPLSPIARGTNRGNKLKRQAKHVWRGGLVSMSGADLPREKVEHAGYTRYILTPNPPRINDEGRELEETEIDEEADAAAAEVNPYSSIDLTETLGPLKHPSELLTHPSMSYPYLSDALPTQVKKTREKLREEQDILWKVKELDRHFTGDTPYMSCGDTEAVDGISLFPQPGWPVRSKKRKRDEHASTTASLTGALSITGAGPGQAASVTSLEKDLETNAKHEPSHKPNESSDQHKDSAESTEDVLQGLTNGNVDHSKSPKVNGVDGSTVVGNGDPKTTSDTAETNGNPPETDTPILQKQPLEQDAAEDKSNSTKPTEPEDQNQPPNQKDDDAAEASERSPSPQQPPPRRITRALAQNYNSSTTQSTNPSPPASPSTSSLPSINPLFALPPSFNTPTTYGLPPAEATETRRLLTSYIQKQEETVRGYQELLNKLLKAQRLRKRVMVWCKAEGHVGEMSDGEDWIDTQYWELAPGELKKGKDEEGEEDEREREREGERGKKGKRRRG
ncbi:MAG: hypothetical protein Q9160_000870 [Pyrenula sp. 1 TL-2023]